MSASRTTELRAGVPIAATNGPDGFVHAPLMSFPSSCEVSDGMNLPRVYCAPGGVVATKLIAQKGYSQLSPTRLFHRAARTRRLSGPETSTTTM